MSIESSVADLTASTTALIAAVAVQQSTVTTATAAFTSVTERVTKGLHLVNNTKDVDKPISSAAMEALSLKQETLVSGVNISTVNGFSLLSGDPLVIVRSATSINLVAYDNRATLRETVSQVDDASMVEGLGLFMWTNTQAEPDDDETCFTTTTGQWLLQAPAWELINAWGIHDASFADDWREDEPTRFAVYLLANK